MRRDQETSEEEVEHQPDVCALCGRPDDELTCHHLIPRARHRKNRTRKQFSRDEMRSRLAWLCPPCHRHIHRCLSEKEMADHYHTVERLLEHDEVARFVAWIRKKPPGFRP